MRPRKRARRLSRKRVRRSKRTFRLRRRGLARTIKRVLLRNAETKFRFNSASNVTLEHNEVRVIANNILYLQQGDAHDQRSGDKVFAKHVKFKLYFENQQYRPRVSYTVLVLRNKTNASADIVNGENIFEGVTSTKSLDFIDYNKYDVIYRKSVTVSNAGSYPGEPGAMGSSGGVDGAVASAPNFTNLVTNANKYKSFTVRLNKNITYQDGSTNPSTQRYALAIIPYINNTSITSGALHPAGHVSMVYRYVFKDP